MPNHRKANAANLVIGLALIAFGVVGMFFAANPVSSIFLRLLFCSVGGYEIGKYEERRHVNREINRGSP